MPWIFRIRCLIEFVGQVQKCQVERNRVWNSFVKSEMNCGKFTDCENVRGQISEGGSDWAEGEEEDWVAERRHSTQPLVSYTHYSIAGLNQKKTSLEKIVFVETFSNGTEKNPTNRGKRQVKLKDKMCFLLDYSRLWDSNWVHWSEEIATKKGWLRDTERPRPAPLSSSSNPSEEGSLLPEIE